MKISSFEDVIAWQKARDLCVTIHQQFGDLRHFAFRDQILKAAISIMNSQRIFRRSPVHGAPRV